MSGSAAVPAAVPAGLARNLHLAAGQTLRLRESVSGAPVEVRIAGIFRPLHPDSPYWLLGSASSGVQQSGGFADYAGICGRLLGKGHSRTSGASLIAGYAGASDKLEQALTRFARRYADQTERDQVGYAPASPRAR